MDDHNTTTDKNRSSISEKNYSIYCSSLPDKITEAHSSISDSGEISEIMEDTRNKTKDMTRKKSQQVTTSTPKERRIPFIQEKSGNIDIERLHEAYDELTKKKSKGRTQDDLKHIDVIYQVAKQLQDLCKKQEKVLENKEQQLLKIKESNRSLADENSIIKSEVEELTKQKIEQEEIIEELKQQIKEKERQQQVSKQASQRVKVMLERIKINKDNSRESIQEKTMDTPSKNKDDYDKEETDSSIDGSPYNIHKKQKHSARSNQGKIQYSDINMKSMNTSELLETYVQLNKRRKQGDTVQANKYLELLQTRIQESEDKIKCLETYKRRFQEAENQLRKWETDINNYKTLETVTKQQKEVIIDLENELQNLQANVHRQVMEETSEREKKLLDDLEKERQVMEEIRKRDRELMEELEKMKQSLQEKEDILKSYIDRDNESIIKNNLQVILEKLQRIENKVEFEQMEQIQQHNLDKSEFQQSEQLQYAQVTERQRSTKISIKNPSNLSKSAILIRRLPNTQLSINDIRTILTRETKKYTDKQPINCRIGRDRNTLIIKSTTEEDTTNLMKRIEEIPTLKDIIEITYNSVNLRRIIILGIPQDIDSKELLQTIQDKYVSEYPIQEYKLIQRNGSDKYQAVYEMEDWIASLLLKQQKFHLGFLTCRILPYMPVIRCNRCQAYGHTDNKCRGREVCQYCTRHHTSLNCPNKRDKNKHRCANCIGTQGNFPHSSNSPDCPAYQFYIQRRNNYAQFNSLNSTR